MTNAKNPLKQRVLQILEQTTIGGSDGIGSLTRIPVVTFLPNRIAFQCLLHKSPSPVLAEHSPPSKTRRLG